MTDTALQPDLQTDAASAGDVDSSPTKADAGGILTINLSAIAANWELLGRQAMPSECAAVIKADGYGCGIEPVAQTLTNAGCRTFFVADISEARRARAAAPNAALYVLNGLLPGTAATFADIRAQPVIGSFVELAEWDAFCSANQWHVRYSTTGETVLRNVQPLFAELEGGGFAIGHNGNLTNGIKLRRDLVHEGAMMQSTTDTEVILHLVARARRNRFVDRFIEGLRQLEGAYAFVGLTNKKLVGARDPLGIRPLVIGKLDGCPILASETCALDIIGAQYVRDVENGEVVIFDEDGAQSHKPFPPMAQRPCIFEYVYFSRPDSIVGGRNVYDVRKTMKNIGHDGSRPVLAHRPGPIAP